MQPRAAAWKTLLVQPEVQRMNSTRTTTFERALERHNTTWSRATVEEFDSALGELLEQPAVGVPLPFEGVSLDQVRVTMSPAPAELSGARTGITPAAFAVADYGTVVVTSGGEGTEQMSLYPDRHVVILRESDILADMECAFERLNESFCEGLTSAVLATGPSATADMGELVYGAHGPRDVHVLILRDR